MTQTLCGFKVILRCQLRHDHTVPCSPFRDLNFPVLAPAKSRLPDRKCGKNLGLADCSLPNRHIGDCNFKRTFQNPNPIPFTPPPRPFVPPQPVSGWAVVDWQVVEPKPKPAKPNPWFHDLALGGWPALTKHPSTVDEAWLFYGLPAKRATRETVFFLWKERARAWHPDRHREATAQATLHFKRNNTAWQILQTHCKW